MRLAICMQVDGGGKGPALTDKKARMAVSLPGLSAAADSK
jgi:hypothetical protein